MSPNGIRRFFKVVKNSLEGEQLRKLAVIGLSIFVLFLIQPVVSAQAEEAAIYTITIDHELTNDGPNQANNVRATISLFDNYSVWADQVVLSEEISVDGALISFTASRGEENRWVEVNVDNIPVGASKTITVVQTLRVETVPQFEIDPGSVGTSIPSEVVKYTLPVDGLFENAPEIVAYADQVVENETNLYRKAKLLFENVVSYFSYKRQLVEHGALDAFRLSPREGDCSDYSNLYIALARAVGVPAKAIIGLAYSPLYGATEISADVDEIGHEWVMIYLPSIGWVPLDLVQPLDNGSFGYIDYSHIVGASVGGENVVKDGEIKWPGSGVWGWRWTKPPPATVRGSHTGTVAPEIALQLNLTPSHEIADGELIATLQVKNIGRCPASNVKAQLVVDPSYFDEVPIENIGDIPSGSTGEVTFRPRVKEGAYGESHTLTVNVTYDSSHDTISGTFLAKGEASVSISSLPAPPAEQLFNLLLYVLVAVIVGSIVALAAVLLRRR